MPCSECSSFKVYLGAPIQPYPPSISPLAFSFFSSYNPSFLSLSEVNKYLPPLHVSLESQVERKMRPVLCVMILRPIFPTATANLSFFWAFRGEKNHCRSCKKLRLIHLRINFYCGLYSIYGLNELYCYIPAEMWTLLSFIFLLGPISKI